ncbi:hypothetical protein [Streptomyces hyaluromycini]|uniref:hypothetical protein n=1 Tax=Streptomyces hyaluromycini TaxID=1377993 RepID=UPI000B5C3C02|nr:hypothetical protein [Streptomyces hyaluromycini]
MTDWLILVGCLVIALTAMAVDGIGRANAEDARLEAFVAEDRRSAFVEPDTVERLGPVELGCLSGSGSRSAKQGAVARLVADGVLHRLPPDGPGPQRWVARGRLPEDADEFERELWTAAAPGRAHSVGRRGHYLWALPDPVGLARAAEARLISEGYARQPGELLPSGGQRHRGRWSTAAAALAVPAVTVLLLDHAWIRAVLALLIGAFTLGAASNSSDSILPRRLPARTANGELLLHLARERFADLNPATRPASKAYDPRTVRMAVALFGATVLERIDDGILADWHKPTADPDGPGE